MVFRPSTYVVALIIAVVLDSVYYRQFFIEHWMNYRLRDEQIVITLSTTPHRINQIKPTIDTLAKQKFAASKIYLSVPYIFKRDNLEYVVPKWLSEDKRVTILRTEDYGPATNSG